MNTQLTQKKDIRSLLQSDAVKQQLALALPATLTPERMTRVALTTVLRTPALGNCRPESLLNALMTCAQAGLEPDGRNAHLVPYGDQVQAIFDWTGLVRLAGKNGVKNIAPALACANDTFVWKRTANGLEFVHEVDWRKPRGDWFAAYVVWNNPDGGDFDGEVMTRDEVLAIKKRSRAGGNGPWVTDEAEMAKKTVIRRASKRWPLDPEVAAAFIADDDVLEQRQMRDVTARKASLAGAIMGNLDALAPRADGAQGDPATGDWSDTAGGQSDVPPHETESEAPPDERVELLAQLQRSIKATGLDELKVENSLL